MGLALFEGGWPGQGFDKDLASLATAETADLLKLADWFKSWHSIGALSPEEEKRLKTLFPDRKKGEVAPTWISVTFFILREWERLHLSLSQITKDFQALGLEDAQVKKLQDYLQGIEQIKRKAHLDYLKRRDTRLGVPVVRGISGTWNLRAIFEEDAEGNYVGEVVEHVPVAILTIDERYGDGSEERTSRTILQFTKESLADFLNAIEKFAKIGEKLEKKT